LVEQESRVHIRPALPGDVCILLEPTRSEEIDQLRERQLALQSRFGGTPIKHVHLTCQRFASQDEQQITDCVHSLKRALVPTEPIPLTALSLAAHYVQVRRMNVLKWRIEPMRQLRGFVAAIERTLVTTGIEPLYASGFVSSLVTALREMPESGASLADQGGFPHHLFSGSKIVVSRICGADEFEILAHFRLQHRHNG
jgi:hypothetical protein